MTDTSGTSPPTEMELATWAYRAMVLVGIGFLGIDLHGFGNDPWFVNAAIYAAFVAVGIFIGARLVMDSLGGKGVGMDVE